MHSPRPLRTAPMIGLALLAMTLLPAVLQAQTQPGFRTELVTDEIPVP